MNKYTLSIILFFIAVFEVKSQTKKVCITVDDLPTVIYSKNKGVTKKGVTEELVNFFKEKNIPAIGFVNERKLYNSGEPDSSSIKLLEFWLQHGLALGNHSYSHFNYHKVGFEKFTKDVLRGEQITKALSKKYEMPYSFFRHPYLRSGKTKGQSDSLKTFLKNHNYIEAPVTLDNEDYLFAKEYELALVNNENQKAENVGDKYIKFTANMIEYYEKLSAATFNRQIPQIFLIHANQLNATYLSELYNLFRNKNYEFISLSEALSDPSYKEEVTVFGDWGISWLERWALNNKAGKELFAECPDVKDYLP